MVARNDSVELVGLLHYPEAFRAIRIHFRVVCSRDRSFLGEINFLNVIEYIS